MMRAIAGQALLETFILTASIAIGVLGLWAIGNEMITQFIDLALTIIASPVP